eukprot:TRINITY_DN2314_c0_g2_i6.p2 TRINITY_DN2314_c0_g2~~TRINITY_DN2314_c0_g2_i6.p2  ORF type:complete len:170 (+),score=38.21 TRINITY_DN2314_c0_g2_i6:46-555(+)
MAGPRRQHAGQTVCPSKSLSLKGLGSGPRRPVTMAGEAPCKVPVPPYRQQGNGARDSWINARKFGPDHGHEYRKQMLGRPEVRGKYGTMRQRPMRPNMEVASPRTAQEISRLPCISAANRGAVTAALNEQADSMERQYLLTADVASLKRSGLYHYAMNAKSKHVPKPPS